MCTVYKTCWFVFIQEETVAVKQKPAVNGTAKPAVKKADAAASSSDDDSSDEESEEG